VEWQLVPVVVLVTWAVWYLGREIWRSWDARKSGCGGGCACQSKARSGSESQGQTTFIPGDQLTMRLRQGKRS
jgi:hypothetical protein